MCLLHTACCVLLADCCMLRAAWYLLVPEPERQPCLLPLWRPERKMPELSTSWRRKKMERWRFGDSDGYENFPFVCLDTNLFFLAWTDPCAGLLVKSIFPPLQIYVCLNHALLYYPRRVKIFWWQRYILMTMSHISNGEGELQNTAQACHVGSGWWAI